jgi:hypothetical protein
VSNIDVGCGWVEVRLPRCEQGLRKEVRKLVGTTKTERLGLWRSHVVAKSQDEIERDVDELLRHVQPYCSYNNKLKALKALCAINCGGRMNLSEDDALVLDACMKFNDEV